MTIHQQIKEKLADSSQDEILKKLGYNNLEMGIKTLQKLIDSEDIYHWLKNGNFDMKYSSEAFLRRVTEVLDISLEDLDEEIKRSKVHLEKIAAMQDPYIYIDTHFKRQNEPIFALAMMERRRHISVDKEWIVDMDLEEVLESIVILVKEHYIENEGKLPLWGKIYTYLYQHTDGSRYVFGRDGDLKEDTEEIVESKAELKIGNKEITNLILGE